MTKAELRQKIKDIEPDNSVATDSRATRDALQRELRAARRRRASREAATAVPAALRYRVEEDGTYSWKLFDDDITPITDLAYGKDLPMIGSIHPSIDGVALRVASRDSGLKIVAGDLCVREEFDPRRVYVTANGSNVTYKRDEGELIVLWSYKHNDEIAVGKRVVLNLTPRHAQPVAVMNRRKTQKIVAAWLIANNPGITGAELTAALAEAFPANRVSSRHGPHYLSLSRRGRLPEPPDEDPREW